MSRAATKRNKKAAAGRRFAATPLATFKRILSYFKPYKGRVVFALICLILNVGSTVAGTSMLLVAIEDYLSPIVQGVPGADMSGFAMIVGVMAGLYVFSVVMSYCYNWLIVRMTTAIQRSIRDEMFAVMEKLPISYFDTRLSGEIMSCYTNDTDTLRELLANGVPYLISNGLTVLAIFVAMLVISPLLTLFVVVMIALMLTPSTTGCATRPAARTPTRIFSCPYSATSAMSTTPSPRSRARCSPWRASGA